MEANGEEGGNCSGFIAVHVGAGNHSEVKMSEYEKVCKKACQKAIAALGQGKSALHALAIAIRILEDSPVTNAGIGSNLNLAGDVECDASIMNGQTNNFGAVGSLPGIKNPIVVAKKLVEQNVTYPSGRVSPMLMCGEGAHDWAVKRGVLGISRNSMITDNSLKSFKKYLQSAKGDDKIKTVEENTRRLRRKHKIDNEKTMSNSCQEESSLDTVGAVCLDRDGNLCSGVSSGGLLLKYPGRIGQAAVYGAGCWAANITKDCPVGLACSSSGCGEELIRTLLCKECADVCTGSCVKKDGMTILQELLQNKFLESPRLSSCNGKLAGIILLKCQIDTTSESRKINVDFSWAHTTRSMAVGFMAGRDQTPQFRLTSLEADISPGSSVLAQGLAQTQLVFPTNGEKMTS